MKYFVRSAACLFGFAFCLLVFFPYDALLRYAVEKAGGRATVVSASLFSMHLRDVRVPLKIRGAQSPALSLDSLRVSIHPLLIGFDARGETGGGSFDLRARGWRRPDLTFTAAQLPLGRLLNDDRLGVSVQAEGAGAVDLSTLTFQPGGTMKGRIAGTLTRLELKGFPLARLDVEKLDFSASVESGRIAVSPIDMKTSLASFQGSVDITPPSWPFQSMTATGDLTSSLIPGQTKSLTNQPVF